MANKTRSDLKELYKQFSIESPQIYIVLQRLYNDLTIEYFHGDLEKYKDEKGFTKEYFAIRDMLNENAIEQERFKHFQNMWNMANRIKHADTGEGFEESYARECIENYNHILNKLNFTTESFYIDEEKLVIRNEATFLEALKSAFQKESEKNKSEEIEKAVSAAHLQWEADLAKKRKKIRIVLSIISSLILVAIVAIIVYYKTLNPIVGRWTNISYNITNSAIAGAYCECERNGNIVIHVPGVDDLTGTWEICNEEVSDEAKERFPYLYNSYLYYQGSLLPSIIGINDEGTLYVVIGYDDDSTTYMFTK